MRFLIAIKDYQVLIAVAISALVTVAYMAVFQVTPWDAPREVKYRRKLVRFHNLAGLSYLEGGHYDLAEKEFQAALDLSSTDETALTGRYLSRLFVTFRQPDWDASADLALEDKLTELVEHHGFSHIVEKYLGDLHYKTNQLDKARGHYERALVMKPSYPDALYRLGWFSYSDVFDLAQMEDCFQRLVETTPYDYRGFHGLGYSLYMKGLRETDPAARAKIVLQAANQSNMARNLSVNRWSIMADFGEVARSVNPPLSLYFHQLANELLEDPALEQVNPRILDVLLLRSEGLIRMKTPNEKRAWIAYQLALDYLASARLGLSQDGEQQHRILLEKANALDPLKAIYPIYSDQLAILDLLLPASRSAAGGTSA